MVTKNRKIPETATSQPGGSIAMIIGISAEITAYETGTDRILAYILVGLGVVLTASAYWPVLHSSARVVRFFSAAGINALTRMMDFS